MEHWSKDIAFYVQETYNTLHGCHNFPAGSRQAARGARICETSVFFIVLQALWLIWGPGSNSKTELERDLEWWLHVVCFEHI